MYVYIYIYMSGLYRDNVKKMETTLMGLGHHLVQKALEINLRAACEQLCSDYAPVSSRGMMLYFVQSRSSPHDTSIL